MLNDKKKDNNISDINFLINKFYKINRNFKYLLYEINKINLNLEEDISILFQIIEQINILIYKKNEKGLNNEETNILKELLISLNNMYNLIYKKYLCYA